MKLPFIISILIFTSLSGFGERPNILFILSDDQALETITALGNQDLKTPHLDQLVREGTTFTRAANMGAWRDAVCVPSRTMMMSGQFLWQAQTIGSPAYKHPLLMQDIKDAGYETYGTGKWHVVAKKGMSHWFHHTLDKRPGELALSKKDRSDFQPWNKSFGGYWEGERHVTDITGNSAIALLDLATAPPQTKPFFLYVGFNAPHSTWQYDENAHDRFDISTFTLPPGIKENHFFIKNRWPKKVTENFVRQRYRSYYIMVERMDKQIGRIIGKLKASGQYENTIIVFLSDHGLSVGENGVMGKQNLYEKSTRAPLIIAGPGIPKNQIRENRIYLQDIMPTLFDYSDIPLPEYVRFKSFRKQIEAPVEGPWEDVYGAYKNEMRSVIHGPNKLVLYARGNETHTRLYNLREDPHELTDLSQSGSSQTLIADLIQRLQNWETLTGGPLTIREHFFQSETKK